MAITWNLRTMPPQIGSTIIARMDALSETPYSVFDVLDSNVQQSIMSNTSILEWAYREEFVVSENPNSKKILSGFKEGEDNDWANTDNGYQVQEFDIYMLRQQINARIQTLPNEVDGFDGIDYMNVIFGQTSVEQKAAVFVDVIQKIPTVKNVTFINASWIDKIKGIFQFTFVIQSIFGDIEFRIGLDQQNRIVSTENA